MFGYLITFLQENQKPEILKFCPFFLLKIFDHFRDGRAEITLAFI